MPRTVTALVKSEHTDDLVSALERMDGVLSLRLHKTASIKPTADVLVIEAVNTSMFEVMRVLEQAGGERPESVTITSPDAVYSRSSQEKIDFDIVETVWEEVEHFMRQTSRLSHNFALLMIFSGALAAIGLSTGALHLVLAAMLVIPGFAPIAAISMGIVQQNWRLLRLGAAVTALGYLTFALAAVAVFHILRLAGDTSVSSFLGMPMVHYWTSFSLSSVIVAVAAASAGIIVMVTHRSVLTAGVMVGLALVPGAAILGIGLSIGQWEFAVRGLGQWALSALSIIVTGLLIFWLKTVFLHKRTSWH